MTACYDSVMKLEMTPSAQATTDMLAVSAARKKRKTIGLYLERI